MNGGIQIAIRQGLVEISYGKIILRALVFDDVLDAEYGGDVLGDMGLWFLFDNKDVDTQGFAG